MAALRKVKREVLRIVLQILEQFVVFREWIAKKRYDANFATLTQLFDGERPPAKKIAIFFIYQPKELANSILVTCEFLHKLGYSVLLVSSTPIRKYDLQKLQSITWKILLRPNYGYDFGGYRDGFRVLNNLGIKPETVLILNDSIWLPLSDENQMIQKMEEDTLLLNGPVFESLQKRREHSEYFQSYLMLVKSKALRSLAFRNYWKNYRVSSRKSIVLVRGEEGFSQELFKFGLGGGAPSTRSTLLELLKQVDNEFLLKTLHYATYIQQDLLIEARNIIKHYSDTEEWRGRCFHHIEKAVESTQPMGAVPYACVKLLGFSFLKKSSFPPEHDGMRWQYLRAVKNGDLPAPHPDILAEIMASKMDGRLTTDPSFPSPIPATKVQ